MSYKCLIEDTSLNTFNEQVKPFLNINEHFYRIWLNEPEFHAKDFLIGYAFRCNKNDLYFELKEYASKLNREWVDFTIIECKWLGEVEVSTYIHENNSVITRKSDNYVIVSKEIF